MSFWRRQHQPFQQERTFQQAHASPGPSRHPADRLQSSTAHRILLRRAIEIPSPSNIGVVYMPVVDILTIDPDAPNGVDDAVPTILAALDQQK